MPVNNYSIVKELKFFRVHRTAEVVVRPLRQTATSVFRRMLVGLGRLELPTSPLSGVRSSHLSYRPELRPKTGGAGRDRTGDLLNANQALSQLSYSPYVCKGSNRGRLDAAASGKQRQPEVSQTSQVENPERELPVNRRSYGLERLPLTDRSLARAAPLDFSDSSHFLS